MPVPAQIGSVSRDDNEMPDPRFDPGLTSRTHVGLVRLIGLDGVDDFVIAERVVGVRAGLHEGVESSKQQVTRPGSRSETRDGGVVISGLMSCYLRLATLSPWISFHLKTADRFDG
jgi:hypothetical protein